VARVDPEVEQVEQGGDWFGLNRRAKALPGVPEECCKDVMSRSVGERTPAPWAGDLKGIRSTSLANFILYAAHRLRS